MAIVVVGSVGATIAATTVARADADEVRRDFEASSAEVASTLQLAIQQEEALIVGASALLVDDPTISTAAFARWVDRVSAFERYPELIGLAQLSFVPAAELPSFAAWSSGDDAGPFGAGAPFAVVPPAERPFSCLMRASARRPNMPAPPPGFDFCAGEGGRPILTSRDTGEGSYEPVTVPGVGTMLGIQIPLYRGGVVPSTVAARHEAFVGWSGMVVAPLVVLDRALAAHPDLTATIRYRVGSSDVVFGRDRGAAGAQTFVTDLHNGWSVRTFGAPVRAGLASNHVAVALLVAGVVVSVLLALIVLVLATGRRRAERLVELKTDELRHQALHDSLTGLANRALLMDRLEHLLARGRRAGSNGTVLYLDLDGFKGVNDSFGHEAGDQLLQSVASRLSTALREADTIARLGGDEFVILLDDVSIDAEPEMVAARILAVLRQPFELDAAERPICLSASIGIATGDRPSGSDLLRDADTALYQSKGAGRDRYSVFQPEMERVIRDRLELELDLVAALGRDEFRLLYQPIYNLTDLTLLSVEALLRWDHPTRGELAPDTFIPLLERSGHILDVGRWVLSEACRQMAAWHTLGSELSMSVNVSARQFDSDAIVDQVREALETSGLQPSCLVIEITESALMHDLAASGIRLAQLKALGVHVAIDDFGTGYSSLAYLQQLPIDSLKIDRSFVEAMSASSESQAIVRTIVQLGRDLGLKTLAEGVETTAQLDQLRGVHVDEAQGYLLARPLDAATFEANILLAESERA